MPYVGSGPTSKIVDSLSVWMEQSRHVEIYSAVCPRDLCYNPGLKSWYTWPCLTISPFLPPSPRKCGVSALKVSPQKQHCTGGRAKFGKESRFHHRTGGDNENIPIQGVHILLTRNVIPILYLLYTSPLGDIVRRHGLSFHFYADDSQLYLSFKSTEPEQTTSIATLEACVSEMDVWMVCKTNTEQRKTGTLGDRLTVTSSPIYQEYSHRWWMRTTIGISKKHRRCVRPLLNGMWGTYAKHPSTTYAILPKWGTASHRLTLKH